MTAKRRLGTTGYYVVSILIAVVAMIPFLWMISTSLKSRGALMSIPIEWIPAEPSLDAYGEVFSRFPFLKTIGNSLFISVSYTVITLISASMAAFAFAKIRFRCANLLLKLYLATMMIPAQLIFLPVFLLFSQLGLINSYWSLILPSASSAFAIFMLRQTFKQVPEELLEAARLDNASEWTILRRIMLPIARPTVVTLALLTFISSWNDYFWPLVLTTNNTVCTLPGGIAALKAAEGGIKYHILMAGNVLLVIPVLAAFFIAQKQVIRAFTYMGEK